MMLKAANRWQAFGLHILVSLLIFVVLAAVIFFWWYPGFLFRYDGGLEGMKLIAGVDFFIGPLLTLLVYKVGKKTLRFDLACIAALQLVCIVGGMWAVWQSRPIAVVYAAGSYATANRHGYEMENIRPETVAALDARWPVWLAVKLPAGSERSISTVWALVGSGLQYNVENYVPYHESIGDLVASGLKASDIKDAKQDLQAVEKNATTEIRFFPVTTSMYEGYLSVETGTGKVLDFFERS